MGHHFQLRYKYQELEDLLKSATTVFCCGHKWQDADSFGANIAMYNLASALGKKAYIIFDENSIDSTVRKVYEDIKRFHKVLLKSMITPEKAVELATDKSLLMVLDCQSKRQVLLSDKHLQAFKTIGIIDHHRKNDEGTIPNPTYYYSEPAASSSVEAIFTLLEFSEYELKISDSEATWMLLGIVVDTNNFVYRTSATTFEIASKLQKYGADMSAVKTYLKEDHTEKKKRNEFINTLEIFQDRVAIAFSDDASKTYERATLAKVSDELISISGIELGITIAYIGDREVGLSARSLGNINCQMIMEQMGGGGHLNNAAAQRKNQTVKEVIAILKEKLKSYLEEDGTMKVILIKENKKYGKKNEIIEVAPGHGNFLIKNGIAMIASPENIKTLEKQKAEENDARNKEMQLRIKEKEQIESKPIHLSVRVGVDGKLFGSITTKQIAEAIEQQFGVKVEKRKIDADSSINSVGEHTVQIQLHPNVLAKVVVYVTEAE